MTVHPVAGAVRVTAFIAALLWWGAMPASGAVSLPQADGSFLTLDRPARRLVTLAPHLAELVFASGSGELLVGTVEYSDHPDAARRIQRVGDAFRFDLEALLALDTDLVLGWASGNPDAALDRLERLNLPVWKIELRTPGDVARALEKIGIATGRQKPARLAASNFLARLERLRAKYRDRAALSYFYQVAERPLYTVNGRHLISRSLAICGAVNVFGNLPTLAPQVSAEAVLLADPDVLVAPVVAGDSSPLSHWQAWPRLKAVRNGALVNLPADEISRATPRLLDSVELACTLFDQFRPASGARPPPQESQ